MNDIASGRSADDVIRSLSEIYQIAKNKGIKVIGLTIAPACGDAGWDSCSPTVESKRKEINNWIMMYAKIDVRIDVAAVLADRIQPNKLNQEFDIGDNIHINDIGNRAVARAIGFIF